MSELVSSDDDSGKAAGVFDDGDAVDLLEPLVDDARAADVREAGRAAVALAVTTFASAHVQPDEPGVLKQPNLAI